MGLTESLKWLLIRRWPAGYRFASRLGERFAGGAHRREVERSRDFFGGFIDEGDLCFDIGANHGSRTEVFLRLGARVVGVEPQPHCIDRLRARFGADPRFHLVPQAVGARPGRATLHLGRNDLISTLSREWLDEASEVPELAEIGWQGELQVPVTTLDRLIEDHGAPDFCKIDVEGFELQVLRGLSAPLPLLSIEYTHGQIRATLDCIEVLRTLGEYRFNLSELESMELSLDRWISAAEVSALLERRYGRIEFGYGALYARLGGAATADGSPPVPGGSPRKNSAKGR